MELLPHQIEALQWLEEREKIQSGGILALDTGMGKTRVMLSLISRASYGANLIICPKTLIHHWFQECGKIFGSNENTETTFDVNTEFTNLSVSHENKQNSKDNSFSSNLKDKQDKTVNNKLTNLKNRKNKASTNELISQDNRDDNMPKPVKKDTDFRMYRKNSGPNKFSPDLKKSSRSRKSIKTYVYKNLYSIYDPDQELLKTKIVICSYSTVKLLRSKLSTRIWDRIILDEAHTIRNGKTKLFQSLMNLTTCKKWCVTATPINNTIDDIISLCKFIGDEPYTTKTFWRIAANERIKKTLNEWREKYLLVKSKDILKLPAIDTKIIKVQLSEGELSMYKDYKNRTVDIYKNWIRGDVSIISVFISMLRLRQIANHYLLPIQKLTGSECIVCRENRYSTLLNCELHGICTVCEQMLEKDIKKRDKCSLCSNLDKLSLKGKTNSSKVIVFMNLVKRLISEGHHKIVVFTQWTSMMQILSKELNKEDISHVLLKGDMTSEERKENIRLFNEGDIKLFLVSISCGSLGINLTISDSVILFEPHYNPFTEKQACDRLHRIGQKKPVMIYRLICEGTIEEKIIESQIRKLVTSRTILGTERNENIKIDVEKLIG